MTPGDDGFCPECEARLVEDVDCDDETGDMKARYFCTECGRDPSAPVPDVTDIVKQHSESEDMTT